MVKDPFKFNEIGYDDSTKTYIFRVFDVRSAKVANVMISDTIEKGIPKNTAYISVAGKNADGSKSEIVENSSVNKSDSFKAVFKKGQDKPSKVFIKDNNDKWVHLKEPSEDFLKKILFKKVSLINRIKENPFENRILII